MPNWKKNHSVNAFFIQTDIDLEVKLYDVHTGARWISFGWNLSDSRCEHALTALKLNIVNEELGNYQTAIPRDCSGCNFGSPNHNCVLNVTESPEGCFSVPISSCSRYGLNIYPQIWDMDYKQYLGKSTAETIPGKNETFIMSLIKYFSICRKRFKSQYF